MVDMSEMVSGCLLTDIPQICLKKVLEFCGELRTLVDLDSAFCCHLHRKSFLSGLCMLEEFETGTDYHWLYFAWPHRFHNFLLWMLQRNFKIIKSFSFNGAHGFGPVIWDLIEANPTLLEHIEHLYVFNCDAARAWELVNRCPKLTELTVINEPNVVLNSAHIYSMDVKTQRSLHKLATLHFVLLERNLNEPTSVETHISCLVNLIIFCPNLSMAAFTFPVIQWERGNSNLLSEVTDILQSNYDGVAVVESDECASPAAMSKNGSDIHSFGVVTIKFPLEVDEKTRLQEHGENVSSMVSNVHLV